MSSKESTTTNSSDGAGTHHSRDNSVARSIRSGSGPGLNSRQMMRALHSEPRSIRSVRSRSSCGDGSSIGSSQSQKPLKVTYKSVTTSGMLFSKKTTSVDCGIFVKDPGYSTIFYITSLQPIIFRKIDVFFLTANFLIYVVGMHSAHTISYFF